MRGDADMSGIRLDLENFNSRLYMRGNEQCFVIGLREISFQFTPLHERQRVSVSPAKSMYSYFNSRLYMRGNESCKTYCTASIAFQFTPLHERQLIRSSCSILYPGISIHASTWEETALCSFRPSRCFHFNSRLYMRGNRKITPLLLLLMYFNSRLYMRGNSEGRFRLLVVIVFQFTPLHERQPKKH